MCQLKYRNIVRYHRKIYFYTLRNDNAAILVIILEIRIYYLIFFDILTALFLFFSKIRSHWTVIQGSERSNFAEAIAEKNLSQNSLESLRNECCFIRKMFQHTSLWLQYLSNQGNKATINKSHATAITNAGFCAGAFS